MAPKCALFQRYGNKGLLCSLFQHYSNDGLFPDLNVGMCEWQAMSRPAACYRFGSQNPEDSDDDVSSHFISAVCWKSESPTMIAANSQGTIKVLVLAP